MIFCFFFLTTKEYQNSDLEIWLFTHMSHFYLCQEPSKKIVTSMMRGRIFCNGSIFGSSIYLAITTFVIFHLVDAADAKKLIIPNSKINAFKVSGSLRYLSKAVFTKAIVGDSLPVRNGLIHNEIPAVKQLASRALLHSNQEDSSDCTKRLLCELQTKENLSWDEELLKNAVPSQIDYTSPTLQMNVAVALGKNNPQQCEVVYNR